MDDFRVKIFNLERQIQCIRPYVNEHLDTAPNDEERDFFDAVAYVINGMLHFLKEVKEDKRLEAIDRLAKYSSLKYVDDKIVAFNREYYDKNKQEHPREPTQTEFVDEQHEQDLDRAICLWIRLSTGPKRRNA